MFIIDVAADVFGEKVNFELSFPSRPALDEVNRVIEAAFTTEIENSRPPNVPPHNFRISKLRLYDEDNSKWVQLTSESQLVNDCQLYAFQPENAWHKESQNPIPPAIKPPRAKSAARAESQSSPSNPSGFPSSGLGSLSRPQTRSLRGLGGSSAVTRSTALVPRAHGDVSYDEKLRIVFAQFDPKGTRSIELPEFKQGFRNLGLDFSSATVEDLFERADTKKDRRVSFSDFERFARLYPIMTDIIYIRSKAFWEEEQLNKVIQSERDTVTKAEGNLDGTMRSLSIAQNEVAQAKQAVQTAEAELRERTERMRDLAAELEDARREKDQAVREKREKEKILAEARDRETEARKDLQDLAREAEKIERRVTSLVSDANAADEKVRQLQKALEEAVKSADRAHHLAEQGAVEAAQARDREQDAGAELEAVTREIPKAEDTLRAADRNVSATEQVIRELDNVGKELGREADEAARRREVSELAVADLQERINAREKDVERARQLVEEKEKQVRARESELDEHRRQRDLASQYERVLIEKELRLRETRDSLEQNEQNLHSEAADFLANLKNAPPSPSNVGRSYSRDPLNL